ncbi:HAMP domain-containing protein [Anaerobacillus sp. CMMVII]|uniref:HAMP domain-containing sensor histidine kinase n=1 Tax=Anaerobacillus sp. CMMVII TaxID=2755588 RepID=UPI0021B7EDC1|nr:cell wall metabolism sensor histidine kinase WalK [Anaerobacillus sp. CMMVII]MCT8136873.1 HAMP domain-containing protein [Anaerobacillus sp. CMMVII]
MNRKGIFTKLFVTNMVIVLVAFVFFCSIFLYLFHLNLYENYEEISEHYEELIKDHILLLDEVGWDNEIVRSSFELSFNQLGRNIFLYDSNGQLLYYPNNPNVVEVDRSIIVQAVSGEKFSKGMRIEEGLIYVIATPLKIDAESAREYVMVMKFNEVNHEYKQLIFMIFITFSITIAVAAIILWLTSKKMTAPLREMNHVALKLAKGNFTEKVKVRSKDEIGHLGETFNYMANELASLEQMRKDFMANVSHDLRSPLTSIKGLLVAFLDGTIPKDQTNYYYKVMKSETERLIKLVNDLLDMTQLEAGQIQLKPDSYNLTEQMRLVMVKMEPQLVKYQLDIELLSEDDDLLVVADADRIEQVLINLIQNAIQHSPPKSVIKLLIEKQGDQAVIEVEDFGRGIKTEDIEKIWERFYKTDRARSKKVGTGIGLSIVKSILDLHHSGIEVRSEVNRGTMFTFRLPLSK